MKKTLLLSLLTILTINTFANFTLNGYTYETKAILTTTEKEIKKGKQLVFSSQDEKIAKLINHKIDRYISRYDNNSIKEIKTTLKANNSYFVSVLIQMDKENYSTYKGFVFDAKTGKELDLSDILAGDYKENLKNILNDKMKQFGLKTSKSYNGMHSVSSFYMENDAIVLIFNKGKASNDFDEVVFIPFFLQTLQQILK